MYLCRCARRAAAPHFSANANRELTSTLRADPGKSLELERKGARRPHPGDCSKESAWIYAPSLKALVIRRLWAPRALAAPDNLHYSAQYADRGTVPKWRRAFLVED